MEYDRANRWPSWPLTLSLHFILFRPSEPSLPSHGPIACGKYYRPAQVRQERERVPWACSVFPTLARPTKRAARGPCALPNAGCVRQRTTLSVGRLTTGHGQSPQLLPAAMNTFVIGRTDAVPGSRNTQQHSHLVGSRSIEALHAFPPDNGTSNKRKRKRKSSDMID